MQIKDIKTLQSNKENLTTWALERGTRFESYNTNAANEFLYFLNKNKKEKFILELGCGDGIALNVFHKAGYNSTGVDINGEKLRHIEAGPRVVKKDIKAFLKEDQNAIFNVFTHHALEHTPDAPEIINLIGERMRPGSVYYAVVPADDYLHSVHHVVFESPEELLPTGLTPIIMEKRDRFSEKEFICMAMKKKEKYMDLSHLLQ